MLKSTIDAVTPDGDESPQVLSQLLLNSASTPKQFLSQREFINQFKQEGFWLAALTEVTEILITSGPSHQWLEEFKDLEDAVYCQLISPLSYAAAIVDLKRVMNSPELNQLSIDYYQRYCQWYPMQRAKDAIMKFTAKLTTESKLLDHVEQIVKQINKLSDVYAKKILAREYFTVVITLVKGLGEEFSQLRVEIIEYINTWFTQYQLYNVVVDPPKEDRVQCKTLQNFAHKHQSIFLTVGVGTLFCSQFTAVAAMPLSQSSANRDSLMDLISQWSRNIFPGMRDEISVSVAQKWIDSSRRDGQSITASLQPAVAPGVLLSTLKQQNIQQSMSPMVTDYLQSLGLDHAISSEVNSLDVAIQSKGFHLQSGSGNHKPASWFPVKRDGSDKDVETLWKLFLQHSQNNKEAMQLKEKFLNGDNACFLDIALRYSTDKIHAEKKAIYEAMWSLLSFRSGDPKGAMIFYLKSKGKNLGDYFEDKLVSNILKNTFEFLGEKSVDPAIAKVFNVSFGRTNTAIIKMESLRHYALYFAAYYKDSFASKAMGVLYINSIANNGHQRDLQKSLAYFEQALQQSDKDIETYKNYLSVNRLIFAEAIENFEYQEKDKIIEKQYQHIIQFISSIPKSFLNQDAALLNELNELNNTLKKFVELPELSNDNRWFVIVNFFIIIGFMFSIYKFITHRMIRDQVQEQQRQNQAAELQKLEELNFQLLKKGLLPLPGLQFEHTVADHKMIIKSVQNDQLLILRKFLHRCGFENLNVETILQCHIVCIDLSENCRLNDSQVIWAKEELINELALIKLEQTEKAEAEKNYALACEYLRRISIPNVQEKIIKLQELVQGQIKSVLATSGSKRLLKSFNEAARAVLRACDDLPRELNQIPVYQAKLTELPPESIIEFYQRLKSALDILQPTSPKREILSKSYEYCHKKIPAVIKEKKKRPSKTLSQDDVPPAACSEIRSLPRLSSVSSQPDLSILSSCQHSPPSSISAVEIDNVQLPDFSEMRQLPLKVPLLVEDQNIKHAKFKRRLKGWLNRQLGHRLDGMSILLTHADFVAPRLKMMQERALHYRFLRTLLLLSLINQPQYRHLPANENLRNDEVGISSHLFKNLFMHNYFSVNAKDLCHCVSSCYLAKAIGRHTAGYVMQTALYLATTTTAKDLKQSRDAAQLLNDLRSLCRDLEQLKLVTQEKFDGTDLHDAYQDACKMTIMCIGEVSARLYAICPGFQAEATASHIELVPLFDFMHKCRMLVRNVEQHQDDLEAYYDAGTLGLTLHVEKTPILEVLALVHEAINLLNTDKKYALFQLLESNIIQNGTSGLTRL